MKLFGRTGGYYLFWTGFVYFWVGMYLAFTHAAQPEIATAIWVCVLALPFVIPPIGRYFNLDVEWDRNMFDFFKKNKTSGNVVPFPDHRNYGIDDKQALPLPYVEPPKEKEKPVHTYYRLGLTDNNRVSFQMGYSEITMNAAGINSMIKLLESYRDLLTEEQDGETE